MGQNQSGSLNSDFISENTQSHLQKRFFVSPHPVYRNNPEFKLLHQKLTNKKYILRIMTVSDDADRNKLQDNIFRKIASKNDYLPKLEHYIFQQSKGYCGKSIKCYLFFKLGEFTTFREEILKQTNHRAPFTEPELLKGIQNLMYGLLWLRFFKQPHQNINTLNIYCNEGNLYLTDPLIAPVNNENLERYISPEKQRKIEDVIQEYDPYVSDVYAIAMCILEALKFGHLEKIYKKNGKINSGLLIEEIGKIKYEKIKELLQRLLISSNNMEYREQFLESFSKKHSDSVVTSQILSEKTQKIHPIGGKRNTQRINIPQPRFMTANDINLQGFKKDKSLPKMQQAWQPEFRHIQRVQTTYKMVPPALQKPTFHYKSSSNNWNPSSNVQQVGKSTSTLPSSYYPFNSHFTLPSFNSSYGSTFTSNYHPLPPPRPQSTSTFIPNMDSLANSFKADIPSKSYVPLSHDFPINQTDFSEVSRKLDYPKEATNKKAFDNAQTYSANISSPKPNSSIFSKQDIDHSSSYSSRFRPAPQSLKKIETSPINLVEHSFPKRISSLKKYSEDKKYVKFLEDHDSIKKCLEKEGWSPPKSIKKSESSPQKVNFNSKIEPILEKNEQKRKNDESQRNNSEKKVEEPMKKQNASNEKIISSNKKNETSNAKKQEENNSFHQSGSKMKQNQMGNGQSNEKKKLNSPQEKVEIKSEENPMPVSERKNKITSSSHSEDNSSLFEGIIDKNFNHLEQGISKAIKNSIKNIENPQQNSEIQNSNSNLHSNIKNDQSESLVHDLQNLPLMTSEVIVNQSQDSRVVSETIEEKVSEGFEINIPDAKDEHLNSVNSSINADEDNQSIPRSPMTPSRPYHPNNRHRYERTIPQEDAAEEESVEDGKASRPMGEYKQEEYPNGGKYCGFILNEQRNGEGTFYYKDGGYYVGQWKDNAMNGYGKLYYDNGILAYEGQWYQDQFHGRGKVYNDNAATLTSSFPYKTFDDYESYWVYYDGKDAIIVGDLSHDMKDGYGKLMLSNNESYIGKFQNDLPHGQGHFHKLDKIIHGIWNQGRLIKLL